jgi:hypothetical protein
MRFFRIGKPTNEMTITQRSRLFSIAFWKSVFSHFGAARRDRGRPITDRDGLENFIRTRAAHVAQTALYGYLRTRAGTRFPELFSNDKFVKSVNVAKWHVWLACLSDLSVYAGGLVRRATHAPASAVGQLMQGVVTEALRTTGVPPDAGSEFGQHADRVRARLALSEWGALTDEEAPFSESPAALVHWAPIADDLKDLDEEIVRNSVRFRWHEVRRDLRGGLDAAAVLASAGEMPARRDVSEGGE